MLLSIRPASKRLMTLTNIDTLSLLPPLSINLGDLRKGVNNYHVDVRISPRFAADVRRLATALTQQATTQNAQPVDFSSI